MSFDASRFSFHPWNDYLGVVMQQGRVQLDADWNEWVAELGRRFQAGTLDTVGCAVVPRTTPEGFHILAQGGALTIGVGRMYVDGLLVENHGTEPVEWDEKMAEEIGTDPLPFFEQPYLPYNDKAVESEAEVFNTPDMSGGPHLVYLDVWQREVNHLQAPELVEKAVGVDTTGRLQTVWQVKLLQNIGNGGCFSPDEELVGWQELIRPSGARLSSSTGEVTGEANPCLAAAPTAGYTGLENQLYRVEIHIGGGQPSARFKWSRDNGTVAASVLEIHDGNRLVVDSLGRDELLGFHTGDWIEILDDWHELHGLPGRLHRILAGNGIDKTTRSIILETALPVDLFPVDGKSKTDPDRHTRIRRWDQKGAVRRADGTLYYDLDISGGADGIPVPPAGTMLLLENGILVDFSQFNGGEFRAGDHWVFAARATDGTIEELYQAPPRGVHHHYARLAIVTLPDDETDCRVFWPPEASGESCDCTVCVHPQSHNSGAATIQHAIDVVRARGGGTICLDVGTYLLRQPLNMQNIRSLRLRGQGWRTVLQPIEAGQAINIARGLGVTIENLSIAGVASLKGTSAMVEVKDSVQVHFSGLTVMATAIGRAISVAIEFSGLILSACVRDSVFVAGKGIISALGKAEYLLTADLHVTNNIFLCGQNGVGLTGVTLHYGHTKFADNLLLQCSRFGFALSGASLPQSSITVSDNILHVQGRGIIGGIDGLRVERNEIIAMAGRAKTDGILLKRDSGFLSSLPIDSVCLCENTLRDLRGNGINIQQKLGVANITSNSMEKVHGGALIMGLGASADYVRIEGNRFESLGIGFDNREEPFFGVLLMGVQRTDISGNLFSNMAQQAETSPLVASVAAMASQEIRIAGNRLFDIGPLEFVGRTAAILVAPGFRDVIVGENSITRNVQADDIRVSEWQALMVNGAPGGLDEQNASILLEYIPDIACLQLGVDRLAYLSNEQFFLIQDFPKISVRGNCLRGQFTSMPSVRIHGVSSCLFDQNDIEISNGENAGIIAGVIECNHVGFSNNRIVASAEISFSLQVKKSKFTVMGNLRSGPIRVNGTPDTSLAPPWNTLNVDI